jgi:hypothetical protein
MIVSPQQMLLYGLKFLGMRSTRWSDARKTLEFRRHYGLSPLDLADQWNDLRVDDYLPTELLLTKKEKTEKGLNRFFNSFLPLEVSQKRIYVSVKRIAALKKKKIVWDDSIADPKKVEIFCITVDGTDFKLNETKHKTLPRDNGACSQKMNHAAAKYEIAMSVYRPKYVHIAGPFKGGVHDLTMFRRGGLKAKRKALNIKIRNI